MRGHFKIIGKTLKLKPNKRMNIDKKCDNTPSKKAKSDFFNNENTVLEKLVFNTKRHSLTDNHFEQQFIMNCNKEMTME